MVGSLSMVGIPIFAGFVSKVLFAEAAIIDLSWKMFPALIALAASTVLNAIYFLKTVLRIYTPVSRGVAEEKGFTYITWNKQKWYVLTIVLLIILNLVLGMTSEPILDLIWEGINNFA